MCVTGQTGTPTCGFGTLKSKFLKKNPVKIVMDIEMLIT
jgi:hypothetical protein